MKKYVVRKGDTMHTISQKTGVKLSLLIASNPQIVNPNQLAVGQVIGIPELGKPAKSQVMAGKSHSSDVSKSMPHYFGFVWPHVVQHNEDLNTIASNYNVPAHVIAQLNPALKAGMQAGSTVYVPFTDPNILNKSIKIQQDAADSSLNLGAQAHTVQPQGSDSVGPNTHHLNRNGSLHNRSEQGDSSKQKAQWDFDADESSSWMSSWETWDNASKQLMENATGRAKPKANISSENDGWSRTLSIDSSDALSDD